MTDLPDQVTSKAWLFADDHTLQNHQRATLFFNENDQGKLIVGKDVANSILA